ncbi:glycine cleavage system protein T [PVC group bacterium (ex Bugula neritina AB1)]|nr:glycine cleavage system protein T [PVC group bacterium (ex Bugula neritina AB1)]
MTHQTILYQKHLESNAHMGTFSNWQMPLYYSGVLSEHKQTRNAVAMFDTCHMGQIFVTGENSLSLLESLVPRDLDKSQDGYCYYTYLCREDGTILDDIIIYRLSLNSFLIIVNAGTLEQDYLWIKDKAPSSVVVTNESDNWFKIDIQGPESLTVIDEFFPGNEWENLKYFSFKKVKHNNHSFIISRTGYTGELGYEVYGPVSYAETLWQDLLEKNVTPAGLATRDLLRLEAGYPLMGQDITPEMTPFSLGFSKFVSSRKMFIGKDALWDKKDTWLSIPFVLPKKAIARTGTSVLLENKPVGQVTSGTWSPLLQKSIGFATIRNPHKAIENITLNIRNQPMIADITTTPFIKSTSIKNNILKKRSSL